MTSDAARTSIPELRKICHLTARAAMKRTRMAGRVGRLICAGAAALAVMLGGTLVGTSVDAQDGEAVAEDWPTPEPSAEPEPTPEPETPSDLTLLSGRVLAKETSVPVSGAAILIPGLGRRDV